MEEIRVAISEYVIYPHTTFTVKAHPLRGKPSWISKKNPLERHVHYYDIRIIGIPGKTDGKSMNAKVSITDESVMSKTQMFYWNNNKHKNGNWVEAKHKQVKNQTITCDIPINKLRGTPITIGTH